MFLEQLHHSHSNIIKQKLPFFSPITQHRNKKKKILYKHNLKDNIFTWIHDTKSQAYLKIGIFRTLYSNTIDRTQKKKSIIVHGWKWSEFQIQFSWSEIIVKM